MRGIEAFIALQQRKNVRRASWHKDELVKFTPLNDDQWAMELVMKNEDRVHKLYLQHNAFRDLLRDLLEDHQDWEVVE